VWHGYRAAERAGLEKVVEAYNTARASSGVKVTLRAIPSDAFTDKLTAAVLDAPENVNAGKAASVAVAAPSKHKSPMTTAMNAITRKAAP
jgi:hypothetical protein